MCSQLTVIGGQEWLDVNRLGCCAAPDRLGYRLQREIVVAAQHFFQLVQFGDAIGVELGVAEMEGAGDRILTRGGPPPSPTNSRTLDFGPAQPKAAPCSWLVLRLVGAPGVRCRTRFHDEGV